MSGAADWVFTFPDFLVPLITGTGEDIPLSIPLCERHFTVGCDMARAMRCPVEVKPVKGPEKPCFECRLAAALASEKPVKDPSPPKTHPSRTKRGLP